MLKLGFIIFKSEKMNEACNILFELEIKYKDAPKNVLERAEKEIKKLDCPEGVGIKPIITKEFDLKSLKTLFLKNFILVCVFLVE